MNLTVALEAFAIFILFASMKAGYLVLVILAIRKLGGALVPLKIRYYLWFIVILSLIIPVGYKTEIPIISGSKKSTDSLLVVSESVTNQQTENFTLTPSQPETVRDPGLTIQSNQLIEGEKTNQLLNPVADNTNTADITQWMVSIWLGLAMSLLAFVLIQNFRFRRILNTASDGSRETQNLLMNCQLELNINRRISVLNSHSIYSPCIVGWLKPVLLLPENIELHLDQSQLRHVFLHELIHVKRHDIAINWLTTLLQCMHWFNPLIWYSFKLMRQDRELICDAEVVKHLTEKEVSDYGQTLMTMSESIFKSPVMVQSIGMLDKQSQLEDRIMSIIKNNSSKPLHTSLTFLLFLPLVGIAIAQPEDNANLNTDNASQTQTTDVQSIIPAGNNVGNPTALNEIAEPTAGTDTTNQDPEVANNETNETNETNEPDQLSNTEIGESIELPTASAVIEEPVTDSGNSEISVETLVNLLLAQNDSNDNDVAAIIESSTQLPAPSLQTDVDTNEDYPGTAQILELLAAFQERKMDMLEIMDYWEETAAACEAKSGIFSTLSSPCRKVKKATAAMINYIGNCKDIENQYLDLKTEYRNNIASFNNAASIKSMLENFASEILEICGVRSINNSHQNFALLIDNLPVNNFIAGRNIQAERNYRENLDFYDPYFNNEQFRVNSVQTYNYAPSDSQFIYIQNGVTHNYVVPE